jgi:hypothetical protein
MVQVVEMLHQEKVEMYRLVDKEKLIEMLIQANLMLNSLTPKINIYTNNDHDPSYEDNSKITYDYRK